MIEKLYLIFTPNGFIGTSYILENSNNISALVDLYSYYDYEGRVNLDFEQHCRFDYPKGSAEHIVLEESIKALISNYDTNPQTYLWSEPLDTNKFDPHPI